jgi:leucyl/phenylalanyl-tRNA---protein transferase
MTMQIPWLGRKIAFPPLDWALTDDEGASGLLAAGGDLHPQRLLAAYRLGIYPWYSEGDPILWWSPDPRMILVPSDFKRSRSLAKRVRSGRFETRFDSAFGQVIRACAQTPRAGQRGTWIHPDMVNAYSQLHAMGYAHSVESWRDGELVGGLYGLALGRAFFGESMFARETDASKVAVDALVRFLLKTGYELIDCQQQTQHLASLGAKPIARIKFRSELDRLIEFEPQPVDWSSWRTLIAHHDDARTGPNPD